MMDSQSRDDEGELIFTEFEGQVLDRFDRIIALLSPPPVNVGTFSNYAFGYSCPRCRSWVRYGETHICATAGTLRERGSS